MQQSEFKPDYVALVKDDIIQFADGSFTRIVGYAGRLIQHTGGFFDPADKPYRLVSPAPNRIQLLTAPENHQ